MQRFKDSLGREWDVSIKLSDIGRLRAVGCDLDQLCASDGVGFFEGYHSLSLAVRVAAVWELVRKQKPEINEEGFADGFDGDTLEAMTNAFCGAVVDFFRKPKMAQLWQSRLRIKEAETEVMRKHIEYKLSTLSALDGASLEKWALTQQT